MSKDNAVNIQLTRAEESVMKALWVQEKSFVREIIERMPRPKPHANTVNTILKILLEKGFVESEPIGNAKQYRAIITKEAYSKRRMKQLLNGYFNNSFSDMVSFFVKEKDLDIKELEAILKTLKNKI
ncbi:MAG: BlaI/MecI/CopY family transcriptional regulator [Bacteroidetes bacterium]|nr:BlaI/MecI/CopY family transcriptional regulator [Bacteroidota bacterium]